MVLETIVKKGLKNNYDFEIHGKKGLNNNYDFGNHHEKGTQEQL